MRKLFLLSCIAVIYLCSFTTGDYNGIDISHHNKVNWKAVAENSNIQFCYIKATEGANTKDPKCKEYVEAARQIRLHVGLYHYFRTDVSAQKQFLNFKQVFDATHTDMIPVIDIEDKGNDFSNMEQVNQNLSELIDLFHHEYGKYPVVYLGSWNATKTLSCTCKCFKWVRCLAFYNLIPNLFMKQIGIEDIGGNRTDVNYCKDIQQLML